ncbi:MAG: trehalose-6-phosphate synthase [Rhizobiaceae bacterium]
MSRLVVVSNRVGDLRNPTQTGGLAVGLADALKQRGGLWFGWDGELLQGKPGDITVEEIGNVRRACVPMTVEDYEQYYVGYANSVLWPLFHYRLDLVRYQPEFYEGYCRVNANFAAFLMPLLERDDLVWVHDYHLIPLADSLRKLGSRQRIGFFLHIPFPPADLVSASPNHVEMVDALLQYDVVGFQTSSDLSNFLHYLRQNTGHEVEDDGAIHVGGRLVQASRFPIGIDVDAFHDMALESSDDIRIDKMKREILGVKQIIGIDRLDYSKGLAVRFQAYARLLSQHPELEKSVSFLQVAPPTREDISAYSEIRTELEGLAGSINGKFADFDWTPIRYIHRTVARDKLAALLRASQVGFVTPLRDGMNLVAKEYVAAQNPDDPGVLVLSQFAGAAEEMQEALLINPHDVDDMARSLYAALVMPLDERRDRHRALLGRIRRDDAKAWLDGFLDVLRRGSGGSRAAAHEPPPLRVAS